MLCAGWFLFISCEAREKEPALYRLTINDVEVAVELAVTDEERQRGLQHREELPDARGMLFVFPTTEERSFWMRDTGIPLSIAFIEYGGNIVQIEKMQPWSEEHITSNVPVKYALEVRQGFFERSGIREGDTVVLPEEVRRLTAK
jgi:uncharacterized membrane protein (UPF0127 family)